MFTFHIGQVITRADVKRLIARCALEYANAQDYAKHKAETEEEVALYEGRAEVYQELQRELRAILNAAEE